MTKEEFLEYKEFICAALLKYYNEHNLIATAYISGIHDIFFRYMQTRDENEVLEHAGIHCSDKNFSLLLLKYQLFKDIEQHLYDEWLWEDNEQSLEMYNLIKKVSRDFARVYIAACFGLFGNTDENGRGMSIADQSVMRFSVAYKSFSQKAIELTEECLKR